MTIEYNSDNYVGVALGVFFTATGVTVLSVFLYRLLSGKGLGSEGRFTKLIPLRQTFPPFAFLWIILFSMSTIGLGATGLLDNLIYANTHQRQSEGFILFWIPYAFCLGTAGMFGAKESFRTKNPVMILFSRVIASIFVLVSLGLAWKLATNLDATRFSMAVGAYVADIRHLIETGKPLA